MTAAELDIMLSDIRSEFKKIPGVISVGYGMKERGGAVVEELAFRVYVDQKKSPEELDDSDIIPDSFQGIPTDVLPLPKIKLHSCSDDDSYKVVKGGIGVSNLNEWELMKAGLKATADLPVGTIGCVCTMDNESGNNKYALLSCQHVLADYSFSSGDKIYNPKITTINNIRQILTYQNGDSDANHIANLLVDAGHMGFYEYKPAGAPAKINYWLDAGIAKITTSISTWCKTNTGTDFANEINGLNLPTGNAIQGIKRLTGADLVPNTPYLLHKVGRSTGKTTGRVLDPHFGYPGNEAVDPATNPPTGEIIIIEAVKEYCNIQHPEFQVAFSKEGDSGAALINDAGEIVGILFGGLPNDPVDPAYLNQINYGSHIHPIMDKFKITPLNVAGNPGPTRATTQGIITDTGVKTGRTFNFKERLLEEENKSWLARMVRIHLNEISELVNFKRPVTLVWHRNKGPEFLAHLIQSSRNETHIIPHEIEGVSIQDTLFALKEILSIHGSPELQHDIAIHYKEIDRMAGKIERVEDLFENKGSTLKQKLPTA